MCPFALVVRSSNRLGQAAAGVFTTPRRANHPPASRHRREECPPGDKARVVMASRGRPLAPRFFACILFVAGVVLPASAIAAETPRDDTTVPAEAASVSSPGADWPMWRYDANRSAATPHALPAELHPQWVREYPPLEPAWEEAANRDRMPYDRVYEPVVSGTTILFGSSRGDWVTALDTRTGRQKWRFYTDGPVRLPPVIHNRRAYFTSDDGHLYCVEVETGRLAWKFRGGPADRKVLGNGRLISAWPARGGPVVADGTVYFAASIWPFMGIFIHALNAETGEVVWTNESLGSRFIKQPHDAPSFSGIAPQGALAVLGDRLLVPGGRSVPGCLDRRTGALQYFHLAGSPGANRKLEGGSHVSAIGGVFFNHRGICTGAYDLETGALVTTLMKRTHPVLTDEACYFSGNPVVACRLRPSGKDKGPRWVLEEQWKCDVDGTESLIKAGERLYAGGKGVVSALELQKDGPPKAGWTAKIDGAAARLLAADNRLFVVTLEGRIHAFGPAGDLSPSVAQGDSPLFAATMPVSGATSSPPRKRDSPRRSNHRTRPEDARNDDARARLLSGVRAGRRAVDRGDRTAIRTSA